jgi:hypothetical protein
MDIKKLLNSCEVNRKDGGEFYLYQYVFEEIIYFGLIKEKRGNRSTLVYNVVLSDNVKEKIQYIFTKETGFDINGSISTPVDFGQNKHYLSKSYLEK